MNNVILFDPSYCDVWFAGQNEGTKTLKIVEDWGKIEKADLTFNLGLFDMRTGDSNCFVKGPRMISDSSGLTDPKMGGQSDILYLNSQNMCKGYCNAIVNGKVKVEHPLGKTSKRNGIGITTDGFRIIAQTSHSSYETSFANAVNNYAIKADKKVELFIMEDGGGSTSEYSAISKLGFHPTKEIRKVATVVCVRFKTLPHITRTLKYGMRGEDVKILQMVLGGIEVDGIFGSNTRIRLRAAQKALGLKVDGSCGPLTRAALGIGG